MADFMNFPTQRERVLASGNTTIGVIPELSLVSHFQVGAWQILYRPAETGNVKRWGIPLMIPNFGRMKDGRFNEKGTTLPIHGFGRNLPWTTIAEDTTGIKIQLTSSDATRPNYPYEFVFTAHIVAGEGTLVYTLTIENSGDEVMPIAPGFHPYFAVQQQDKAKLVVESLAGFDASTVKWDTNPPDAPYPFPHSVSIQFPGQGRLLIAEVPGEDGYALSEMQVWSEPASAPDHNFVCFEPIVTREDGLNRPQDRLNLAPHETRQITWQITAEPEEGK